MATCTAPGPVPPPRPAARWLRAAVAGLALLPMVRADVRLPGLFTHNLVLQQELPVPVWGWAEEGEEVTVQFRDQRVTANGATKRVGNRNG